MRGGRPTRATGRRRHIRNSGAWRRCCCKESLVSFRALKYLSFTHSAIYTALLVLAITGAADSAKYALGWAHGVGWIVMSLLCIDAVRRQVIPLWLGVMVAVVGGVGPFAGTAGFIYAERRADMPPHIPQRDMV